MFARTTLLALLVTGAAFAKAEDREVPGFEKVQIANGFHAVIEIGPLRPVHLEGDARDLAEIEVVVENGSLRVGYAQDSMHWPRGNSHQLVNVRISTPALHGIKASGGSEVRAALTRADTLEIAGSGGSVLTVKGVDAGQLNIAASGGSVLAISGHAKSLQLSLSGGSHLTGKDLSVNDLDVHGSGGSEVELHADGRLHGGLSGGSQLHIRGRATGRVHRSGGSEVNFED
jgi:hypothetical protein